MKPKVLVTRRVFPEILARLSERFDLDHNESDVPYPAAELARRAAQADGILSTVMDRIDEPVIAAGERLGAIANIAVGYNNVDVAAATRRGIRVTNTPGVLDETTADLTWALLMAAARRIAEGDAFVRRGDWKVAFTMDAFLGADLHGATLGILGMGRIGQAIARRARGFDMKITYHNRSRLPEADESRLGATWVERDRLLADSDFIVVMVPYSPAVHHFIKAEDFAKMKPTAVFVNTARGGVVDDAALIEALSARRIAAAGVDVFEGEPALNPGYLGLSNVVLTPHIGSASRATRLRMCETAATNLIAALEGRTPPNLVNPQVLTGAKA
ncbi:MAG TPA: D-glycerate dehydrogenase [Usitatibacteraceae bacterium]|jgi:gluconate 2-dehydrogenase|nr:D-glycerate dehydrogenase [Usitatibacteraceae bacterium]